MKPEDKKLLLQDLCARLPYHVIVKYRDANVDLTKYVRSVKIEECKPYLRPMSSMTEEERKDFIKCAGYEVEESQNGRHYDYYLKDFCGTEDAPCANVDAIDWLNANHFDYRGLIEKGLALEAQKGMYK